MAGELVTAGAAVGGPWGAVIGGVAEVAIAVSKPTPIKPAFSQSAGDFDGSGWNVNFGSGNIDSSASSKSGPGGASSQGAKGLFDGSGWNVNFSSGDITSTAKKTTKGANEEWITLATVLVVGMVAIKGIKKW